MFSNLSKIRDLMTLERYDDAHRELLNIVEAEENHIEAYVLLAQVLSKVGQHETAIAILEGAVNLCPDRSDILEILNSMREPNTFTPLATNPSESNVKRSEIDYLQGKIDLAHQLDFPSYEYEYLSQIARFMPNSGEIHDRMDEIQAKYLI